MWIKLAAAPLAVAIIGAAFFLTSGQATGAASSGVALEQQPERGSSLGLLLSNFIGLPELWAGHLGTWGLGWLDTPMLPTVWVVMIALSGALTFWALRVLGWRKSLALALLAFVLIAFPLYVLHGLQASVGSEVQPRYLLPIMVMFVGVALTGLGRDDLGLGKLQAVVVFAGVAVAHSRALHSTLRRYITGVDEKSFNLNARIEWWWSLPVQPMTVWLVGSAAFGLLLLGLYFVLFTNRGRELFPMSGAISSQATTVNQAVRV